MGGSCSSLSWAAPLSAVPQALAIQRVSTAQARCNLDRNRQQHGALGDGIL